MFDILKTTKCNCNHCNKCYNPMHYEMRQIYDPMLNPHMKCNHPANYYNYSNFCNESNYYMIVYSSINIILNTKYAL